MQTKVNTSSQLYTKNVQFIKIGRKRVRSKTRNPETDVFCCSKGIF